MTTFFRRLVLSAAVVAAAAFYLPHSASAEEAKVAIGVGSWGYAGDRKDVKGELQKLCDGKDSCTFMVRNETLGLTDQTDPSPGNRKGLMVFWKCGETEKKDQFPEGKNAVVTCN
jgi:hypothetical protein